KRPIAGVAGMVCPAFPALVSRGHGDPHFLRRACAGMDAVSPATISHRILLSLHGTSNRHHRHRELLLPELPGSRARCFAARRPLPLAIWTSRGRYDFACVPAPLASRSEGGVRGTCSG